MKPHITELTGLIAKELDVNTSQVGQWAVMNDMLHNSRVKFS